MMESSHGLSEYENIDSDLHDILKCPDNLDKPQLQITDKLKKLSQNSYNSATNKSISEDNLLSKPSIKRFDDEEIWQQSELLNKAASKISKLVRSCKESSHNLPDVGDMDTELNDILKLPESFYKPQPLTTDKLKKLIQTSYSIAVKDRIYKGKLLSKLLIKGFDEEQIWQQSELLNKAASKISEVVHKCNPNDVSLLLSLLSKSKPVSANDNNRNSSDSENSRKIENDDYLSSDESNVEEEYAFDDDSDSPAEFMDKKGELLERKIKDSSIVDELDYPSEFENKEIKVHEKKSKYTSVVDDRFFKLSNLEDFLRIEDLKEERGEENDSENEIDLFQDIPSEDDNSDEDSCDDREHTKKPARELMYEDFFDSPDLEIGTEDTAMNDYDENSIDADYSFGNSEEMENGIDKENENKATLENSEKKTTFELEQEKVRKKIQEYEKSMLQPLPWHLTGEVAAGARPIDSLVHQETDFDSNKKQDLLIDKALTEKIEEITIMAIRNKAYFDVERKYKPTEDVINYKKEVALEQTKSKKSLAEVYEDDYLKKQNKQTEEEEDPKHKEIKKLMDSLFPQLHALFSHIPKPALPEIKIVSNLPAVTIEEVAPTSVSDATLLAPEEVKKKTGLIKGTTERTDTDRKHERRKKKIHQKMKEKKKLKKLEALKENPSLKVSKLEKLQTLKKLKQHKNTKIASIEEGGKIKSSKDFFSRLQDTVDSKSKEKQKNEVMHKKMKIK